MKEMKLNVIIIMSIIALYGILAFLYNAIFLDYPFYTIGRETRLLSYGLIVGFIVTILSLVLLIFETFKSRVSKLLHIFVWDIAIIMTLKISYTILYGRKVNFLVSARFGIPINFFGMYELDVDYQHFTFFYQGILMSIVYTIFFLYLGYISVLYYLRRDN